MPRLEWLLLAVIVCLLGAILVIRGPSAANGYYAMMHHQTPEDESRMQKLRERVARIEGRLEAEGLLEKSNP